MTLYIWKYKDTPQKNYFEGCTYIDKIAVSSFIEIPSFTQEFNSETDFTQLKTDNFTVRLSRLTPEISEGGDTFEDFLFPFDDKDYKYLVLFEPKTAETADEIYCRRTGFILIDSIEVHETIKQGTNKENLWYIEFTVIGILREFAEYYESKNITALNPLWDDITFDNYIQNLHFTLSPLWELDNRLNMTAKVGSTVKVSTPLQNDILTNHGINISQWRGFKDMAFELGFSFQLICSTLNPYDLDAPYFTLFLFWRSDGLQTITVNVLEHVKGISLKYNNKWVFMANRHHITTQPPITRTDINGWIINADSTYNFDSYPGINSRPIFIAGSIQEGFGSQGENIIIALETGPFITVQWTDIFGIESPLYGISNFLPKINAGSITYSRIFVLNYNYVPPPLPNSQYTDSGVQQIMINTVIAEYRFLLRGIKESKKLNVVYDNKNNTGLFNKFDITQNGETKTYLIERISNINISEKTCEIDCIEA